MSMRLVVVALMLTAATVLAVIAYQVAQPPRVVAGPGPVQIVPETARYLVAAHALPAGTLARNDDFMDKTVPPDKVPTGALIDTPEVRAGLRGALIRHYVDAALPVMEADVLRPRDRGFLATVLEPGMRAVSVGVDAVTGVAGLIWPGDRVDVILTQELDPALAALDRRILAETALTDLRVIAVDQEIVQGASPTEGVTGHLARTVTLQVTPEQAQKLAIAQRLGHLALAIRSAAEGLPMGPGGPAYSADVSPTLSAILPTAGAQVHVIQGDTRQEVTFH